MENAVQALKTAAAVLIFVIAITVTFTMFSKAKQTADVVTKSQDEQEYLEAADLAGTLYTTTESASTGDNATITTDGYRIVDSDDVISTIYRYNLEKYGVTLVTSEKAVIARFDSNTENVIRQWYNIQDGTNSAGQRVTANEQKQNYVETIKNNITVTIDGDTFEPSLSTEILEDLYEITVEGNNKIQCGAPWYGNETEIIKRINEDIAPTNGYTLNRTNLCRKKHQ